MIEEPQSVFLGHVVPYSGHGMCIAVALHRFLKSRGWDKDIVVVGCDGTNTNLEVPKAAFHISRNFLGIPWSGMSAFFMAMNFHFALCLLCMLVKHQGLIHFRDLLERSCKVISPWESQSNVQRSKTTHFQRCQTRWLQSSAMTKSICVICAGESTRGHLLTTWNSVSQETFVV